MGGDNQRPKGSVQTGDSPLPRAAHVAGGDKRAMPARVWEYPQENPLFFVSLSRKSKKG